MHRPVLLLLLFLVLPMIGCSTEAFKRGVYDHRYQRYCAETAGRPDCDPEHKNYDRYKRDRETLKTPDPDI